MANFNRDNKDSRKISQSNRRSSWIFWISKKRKGKVNRFNLFSREREREKNISIQKKVRREIFSSILWILFFFYFLPLHDKNFRDISLFLEMTKMETRKIACNQKNPLLNE